MGNYSRNTYDPLKRYVAVRLQQGVPLVDADWNELNDVARHELYDSLATALPDGVPPGDAWAFRIWGGVGNDLWISPGRALVKGRLAVAPVWGFRYSDQPWTNPAIANRDGVAVIPPLTTPGPARTDIVYLDVWEREVGSQEDPNLINPVIGMETCVRLKREVAVRVSENSSTLPFPPPAGHLFLPLALLKRTDGAANITNDQIADIRPYLEATRGSHTVSFPPAFLPITSWFGDLGRWLLLGKPIAFKPANQAAYGVLPLALPDRARVLALRVRGNTSTSIRFILGRVPTAHPGWVWGYPDALVDQTISPPGADYVFDSSFFTPSTAERINIVDNQAYHYGLLAIATGNEAAWIYGVSLTYAY